MADTPKRRSTDRVSSSPTLIGAGSQLAGNLNCEGDLVVSGWVKGDSVVAGSFTLSEGARWEGKIQSANAVVAGEIEGSLTASDKLEIRKSARIRGSVTARTLAIAEGAVIEGDMSVTSANPVIHYDEKRKT